METPILLNTIQALQKQGNAYTYKNSNAHERSPNIEPEVSDVDLTVARLALLEVLLEIVTQLISQEN